MPSPLKLTTACILLFMTSTPSFALPLQDLDLRQLRKALDAGEVSAEQLVRFYQQRIEQNDQQGDRINAVIRLDPRALANARAWDAQRARNPGAHQGALAGIPYLAKDNIDALGLPTSGGSWVLRNALPAKNATVIERLQANGAILLGKTNLSELAASYGWMGYSAWGGQTLNPHNLKHDASGSSSGSAAAVAAGFAPFALGTDTSGSVRAPASVTGTVGMRPSLGLISRSGILPLSLTFDTAGVISRSVGDQAIVLDVIQGPDPTDAATTAGDLPEAQLDERTAPVRLDGRVIGVVNNFGGAHAGVDQVFEQAKARAEQLGARLVAIHLPERYETLWATVLGPRGEAEFTPQFERYLHAIPGEHPRSLTAFVKAAEQHQRQAQDHLMNPARLAALKAISEHADTDSPAQIALLTSTIPSLRRELTGLMEQAGVDVLMFPTINCPASVVHGQQDTGAACTAADTYASAYIASSTGFPEISVPAGVVAGNLPVGVSFLGRFGDDMRVLQVGRTFLGR